MDEQVTKIETEKQSRGTEINGRDRETGEIRRETETGERYRDRGIEK